MELPMPQSMPMPIGTVDLVQDQHIGRSILALGKLLLTPAGSLQLMMIEGIFFHLSPQVLILFSC